MLSVWMVRMGKTSDDRPLSPNDTIAELLATYPAAARVLVGHRMHCVGCEIAQFETIADACIIYDVSVDDVFAEIHNAMGANSSSEQSARHCATRRFAIVCDAEQPDRRSHP